MAKRPIPLDTKEREQVKILRAAGLTWHRISKELDRDPKTIKKACLDPEMAPQIEQVKIALADRFEDVAVRMLTAISDSDINALDGYKKTLSGAIAADKMRLLKGESTANIALHTIVEQVEREEREQLVRERRKEAAQQGAE